MYYNPEELKAIAHEKEIVWLKPRDNYRYVREDVLPLIGRSRRPNRQSFPNLVAYAVLQPDAPPEYPGEFLRRIWWVASHDPYGGNGSPCEAVDPLSIQAGKPSLMPPEEKVAACRG